MIQIYTDGSATNNGKKDSIGGWGVVVVNEDGSILPAAVTGIVGATNNQMELEALNFGLLAAMTYNAPAVVYCDSAYCVNMYNDWIDGWAAHNWCGSNKQPVKNLEQVQAIYKIKKLIEAPFQPLVTVKKVKGHSGVEYNELADRLATGEIKPEDV